MTSSHVLPPGSRKGRGEGLGYGVCGNSGTRQGEGLGVQTGHLGPCSPSGLGSETPKPVSFVCLFVVS